MQIKTARFSIRIIWDKLPVIVKSVLSGFIVSSVGIAVWTADIYLAPMTLAVPIMIIPLWCYWRYFSGKNGSKNPATSRKNRFRAINLPASIWKWGLTASLLFVVIIQSSFVITFRLIDMPAGYTSGYRQIETLPHWLAWSIIVMSSAVAGICEETGFRGYMQVPLEKRYGPVTAILVVAVVFTAIHLNKVWAASIVPNIFIASVLLGILAYKTGSLIPGIIGHTILDIFDYSFWWTNLITRAERPTVSKVGIDTHFIIWCLIFAGATAGFIWTMTKLQHRKTLPLT